jgi:hypothetical protein
VVGRAGGATTNWGRSVRLFQQPEGGGNGGQLAEPRLPYPPVAGNAARFAEGMVATARQVDGVHLDYTTASLEEVDRILGTYHDDALDPDRVAGTVFALGCYAGEVLVRQAGGAWEDTDPQTGTAAPTPGTSEPPPGPPQLSQVLSAVIGVRLPTGTLADPVGQAFRRVADGPGSSVASYCAALLPAGEGSAATGYR